MGCIAKAENSITTTRIGNDWNAESEKTKLNELNQLEMDYQKSSYPTSPELRGELTAQYELIRKQLEDMQRLRAEMQADPVAGIKDGFAKFGDSVMDVMGNVSQITQNALSGMTDSLTTFVLTGKATLNLLHNPSLVTLQK